MDASQCSFGLGGPPLFLLLPFSPISAVLDKSVRGGGEACSITPWVGKRRRKQRIYTRAEDCSDRGERELGPLSPKPAMCGGDVLSNHHCLLGLPIPPPPSPSLLFLSEGADISVRQSIRLPSFRRLPVIPLLLSVGDTGTMHSVTPTA